MSFRTSFVAFILEDTYQKVKSGATSDRSHRTRTSNIVRHVIYLQAYIRHSLAYINVNCEAIDVFLAVENEEAMHHFKQTNTLQRTP